MYWKKVCILALLTLFIVAERTSNGYAWSVFPEAHAFKASGGNIARSEELLYLVNQYRTAHGLPSLTMDARLVGLAQEHAEEMAKQGVISHDLLSGNLSVRMRNAGYKYKMVRENLARSRTISYAHYAWLESPSHKSNILAADVSHIGIGIAKGDPATRYGDYLFIVEIFASPRKDYEPSQIKESLMDRIEKLRQESPVSTKHDSTLEKMAAGSLLSLKNSYSSEDLHSLLEKSADELLNADPPGVSRLYVSVQLLDSPDRLIVPHVLRQGFAGMYGTAVRRITDNDNSPAFMVLTLVGVSR